MENHKRQSVFERLGPGKPYEEGGRGHGDQGEQLASITYLHFMALDFDPGGREGVVETMKPK